MKTFRLKQIDYDGTFEHHPGVEVLVEVPTTHFLSTAYPNPFNSQTRVMLSVPHPQHVEVRVHDLTGRRVAVLFTGFLEAQAPRSFTFDAANLPSGIYLIRAVGERFVGTQTVTLLK